MYGTSKLLLKMKMEKIPRKKLVTILKLYILTYIIISFIQIYIFNLTLLEIFINILENTALIIATLFSFIITLIDQKKIKGIIKINDTDDVNARLLKEFQAEKPKGKYE